MHEMMSGGMGGMMWGMGLVGLIVLVLVVLGIAALVKFLCRKADVSAGPTVIIFGRTRSTAPVIFAARTSCSVCGIHI